MKITNHEKLPEPLVRAITLDPYEAECDYSTTTLIRPPRIVALERKHADELTEDASERIWALMGQLGHLVLERAGEEMEIVEKRFYYRLMGKKIGGKVDLWNDDTLLDYKFTSVWSVKGGVKAEWEQQMNINAFLCQQNGVNVKQAQIVCIFRDWSIGKVRRQRKYPQRQVRMFDVPLWPPNQQLNFLTARLLMHQNAQVRLPECTPMERWERNGEQIRCMDYCSVASKCEQWQKLKESGLTKGATSD